MSQIDKEIGHKIKVFRKKLGLQAKRLAEQLSISPSYLNLIESGKRKIDGDLLLRISQELRIELSDLSIKEPLNLNNSKIAISKFSNKKELNKLNLRIGPKIKAFRRQLGLQANKLSEQLGISPSYLNLIESGKRKIDGDLVLKVCKELKIELSDLTSKTNLNLENNIAGVIEVDKNRIQSTHIQSLVVYPKYFRKGIGNGSNSTNVRRRYVVVCV